MNRIITATRFTFTLVSALAIAGHTVGCANEVDTSDESANAIKKGEGGADAGGASGGYGDGGREGNGSSGGATPLGEPCASYAGAACKPGDTQPVPNQYVVECYQNCDLVKNETCTTEWVTPPCNTPLVLSFDGAPVEYRTDGDRSSFDLSGSRSQLTDWPTAKTPWLALDRDGSGRIEDGAELFGSMTRLSNGTRARNGFAALRELDTDGDGRITPADAAFSSLLVWADADGDRLSSGSEIVPAKTWELLSIDLAYVSETHCDARGNCEVERAPFTYRDASGLVRTGAVIDIHLAEQR